jgi:mono/diheme cytochrome c family protein
MLLAGVAFFCPFAPVSAFAQAPAKKIDFARDIKPLLSNRCFRCHGPDADERKGGKDGLRLDQSAGATADLGGSVAIKPGKPEESELIKRIKSTDPEELMPPKSAGKPLSPHEIELISEWIKQGAHYTNHWSYIKPVRPELPAVKDAAWPKNEIDRFILARLEADGLKPSPEADRYALIRRLSLDLTGLPPTLAEADAFANDKDPLAYEKVVDRLLKSESYGENLALMWLDLARYADSSGYADDPARKIWLFRDYVIKSLNANKPFDQFTLEQIAGDLLPKPTDDQLIATAFHRNTLTNNEGGTNDEEFRNVAVVDRVNTTMAVWMGTTIACAQCHSHKYDPITQEEYFKFFAIFNNSADADRGDESPLHQMLTEEQRQQRTQWEQQLVQLQAVLKTATPELKAAQMKWEAEFPREMKWRGLKPTSVKTANSAATQIVDDGSVRIPTTTANDTYTVELPLEPGTLQALRLEALVDDALPGKGPGHAGGNFVLTKFAATVIPADSSALKGRFIRIEMPGKGKILSLAEVQAFQGSENVAPKGEAKQSSTDYEGEAKRANDGNTNGHYYEAKSTTHTAISDDPWWEVDLKTEQRLDRIVLWNRTDGAGDRLVNVKVIVLNEKHESIWEKPVTVAPNPSQELALSGLRDVEFAAAFADYSQSGFNPDTLLNNKDPKNKGWAVGGAVGQSHALTLIAKSPIQIAAGSKLSVTLDHGASFPSHTLGHFRLSASDEPRVAEWARTPAAVVDALLVAEASRTPAQQDVITQHFLSFAPGLDAARKQMTDVQKQLAELKPDTVPIMQELPATQRRVTKLQHRGNFQDLGQEVHEGTPAAFPPIPEGVAVNRLSLAKWLVDDNNPLTARVIANRYWEQIFGTGIVATSEEFGSQGDQPFHPELLDWLATEMQRQKWDMKAFLKTLVMSAAYRQSSRVTPELMQLDPENRLLARGPRFRLSAENVRDQALFAAGLLSPKMYGPPVKPPQPSIGLSAAFGAGIDWQTSAGSDKYRRGLYTTWRRSNPYPSMAAFDAPNREVCTVRRIRTNTPLQALVTLNDPVYIEAAQAVSRRIISQGGASTADRAAYGFRLCLTRPPHPEELQRIIGLYEKSLVRFQKNLDEAKRMATEPLGAAPDGMNVSELAAWTVVGNVLLNLDETLMKR